MFQQEAFGIELGDGALKAVKLERRGTRLVITFADYRPYARPEDGAARPSSGLEPRAFAALTAFLAEHRPSPLARVFVGMPSIAAYNKVVRVPDIGAEQLPGIADFEIHRAVRGPIEDYVVRTRVMRAKNADSDAMCGLFAIRRKIRDAFVSDLSRAGLEFDMVVPSPVALAQFARYDRPTVGDRIVISIGLRATEVVYEHDGVFCYRTLPLGCIGLKVIAKDDETLRQKAARRLVKKLSYEIGAGAAFFFGEDGRWDPQSVWLFGEGAIEREIANEFERHYGGRLETIGNLRRIAVTTAVDGEARQHVGQMGSALGLALLAARADESAIELVKPHLARAAARRVPSLAFLAFVIAVVCGCMTWRDISDAQSIAKLAAVDPGVAVAERRAEFATLVQECDQENARQDAVGRLLAGRASRGRVLSSLLPLFGPEVKTLGAVDFRLRSLAIDRTASAATLQGEALLEHGDADRARNVLEQRLQLAESVVDPKVKANPAEPNRPLAFTFEAAISPAK